LSFPPHPSRRDAGRAHASNNPDPTPLNRSTAAYARKSAQSTLQRALTVFLLQSQRKDLLLPQEFGPSSPSKTINTAVLPRSPTQSPEAIRPALMRSSPWTFRLLQLFPPLRLHGLYIPEPVAGTQQQNCCCGCLLPVPRLELPSRLDSDTQGQIMADLKYYTFWRRAIEGLDRTVEEKRVRAVEFIEHRHTCTRRCPQFESRRRRILTAAYKFIYLILL